MKSPFRCVGLVGRLFGHRFTYRAAVATTRYSDHCMRCGMPSGGWKE